MRFSILSAGRIHHIEYCSHLWAGAPKYQLDPQYTIHVGLFVMSTIPSSQTGWSLFVYGETLSPYLFYRLYNGESSEELFELVRPSRFHDTYIRPGIPRPYGRLVRSILELARCRMDSPPQVFPLRYDMGFFKKQEQNSQSIGSSSGVANMARIVVCLLLYF